MAHHLGRLIRSAKTDFVAKLEFKTTEQGGRRTPAKSGIRPSVKFGFSEMQTTGVLRFLGRELVSPGESVQAEIVLASPDFLTNKLAVGMRFELKEGANVTAIGQILEIKNADLRA